MAHSVLVSVSDLVAYRLGNWCLILSLFAFQCDPGHVVHTHWGMLPSSAIWNRDKLGGKRAYHATHFSHVLKSASLAGVWLRAD